MEIDLRNSAIRKELDVFVDQFYTLRNNKEFPLVGGGDFTPTSMKHRCSEKVLREEYLPYYLLHDGFPRDHCAVPIGNIVKSQNDQGLDAWGKFWYNWKAGFMEKIGANQSTLLNYYQGWGGVGWHTNYKSAGYQVVLTWSRLGDGCFSWYDPKTDTVHMEHDRPGWQARWFYFGNKEGPVENHCWHSMWTNCDRFTLCYNWALRPDTERQGTERHEALKGMMLDFVEELETK